MKYQECEVKYTDIDSRYEVKATSFYIIGRDKQKVEYNRAKVERKLEK